MKIFLIGFMGSGKSTNGRILAEKLNCKFIDLDKVIEEKHNTTINNIFEDQGEARFRVLEHITLKEEINNNNIVLATGGGTPCFFNNMDILNNTGITVYLKCNHEFLINRLTNDSKCRPLIMGKSQEELSDFITEVLNRRERYYNMASIIYDSENFDLEKIIELIHQHYGIQTKL